MARLPVVGSDTNNWGTLLNAFLLVAHNADGTLINGGLGLLTWNVAGTLTTQTGVAQIPIPASATIGDVTIRAATAPTGASIKVDVNKNGTTVFTTQANRPTIAVSTNASSAAVPDVAALAAGDYLTVDIDQVGSTIAGADLVVVLRFA